MCSKLLLSQLDGWTETRIQRGELYGGSQELEGAQKVSKLPFKWILYNNETVILHAPLVVLYFTLWGLVKCLLHALHFGQIILPVFDHCNEWSKYGSWFAPVSGHVWCDDDDILINLCNTLDVYVRCYVFSKMELTVVGNSEGKPDATWNIY
jgi:hypothetical protein